MLDARDCGTTAGGRGRSHGLLGRDTFLNWCDVTEVQGSIVNVICSTYYRDYLGTAVDGGMQVNRTLFSRYEYFSCQNAHQARPLLIR